MKYVVYLDVVLVGNIVMNYVILWTTAKFARYNPSRWRLFCGAAVGSIYALSVFIPGLQDLLFWLFKLAVSVLMVLCTFAPLPWRRLLVVLGYFYLAAFGIGGAAVGIIYFIASNNYPLNSVLSSIRSCFWYGITGALLAAWLVGKVGAVVYHKRTAQNSFKTAVTIKLCRRQVQVDALIDTGNSLTDPLTGLPVMIVEFTAVKPILPKWLCEVYEANDQTNFFQIQQSLDSIWSSRIRFIPYQSLGKKNGLLLAFQPDELHIQYMKNKLCVSKALVAVHHGELSPDNGYRALLHPELLKTA